jgi:hypothetical protein
MVGPMSNVRNRSHLFLILDCGSKWILYFSFRQRPFPQSYHYAEARKKIEVKTSLIDKKKKKKIHFLQIC